MNYYDFNRKQLCDRTAITSVYGAVIGSYADERLAEVNIYPVGQENMAPAGMAVSGLQSAAERDNGGPVYTLIQGKAVRQYNYVPIDATKDSYGSLWIYLVPSKTKARIIQLAETDLTSNTMATLLMGELTVGRSGGTPSENVIKPSLQHFIPLLQGDEPAELAHILTECGLAHLLS